MVTASDGFRGLGIQPEASGSVFARDASGPRSWYEKLTDEFERKCGCVLKDKYTNKCKLVRH